jgi:solute carrier family 45 protein 1/2/4
MLGGHVRAVFTLITFIFVFCVAATITSFREIPLAMLDAFSQIDEDGGENGHVGYGTMDDDDDEKQQKKLDDRKKSLTLNLGQTNEGYESIAETSFSSKPDVPTATTVEPAPSLMHYLLSIVHMPKSLQTVCVTNFFCWSAHVCYSLYFTDFVGESVFGGDPKAPYNSPRYNAYEEGVRFGCFGMAMYSLSCACYSLVIEKLIWRFRAKRVYIGGLLFYSASMTMMALTKHKVGVIVFSWGAGVMYSTLFTMPYLLIAHYHAQGIVSMMMKFEINFNFGLKDKKI